MSCLSLVPVLLRGMVGAVLQAVATEIERVIVRAKVRRTNGDRA